MGIAFENRGLYEHYPAGQTVAIGCMDDRPGELWLQTGGGVYGLAQDRAAAMEMVEPGSFDELNMDVGVFTGAVTGALAINNIQGKMHYGCAAFEQADGAVAETLFDDAKLHGLFGIAKDIYVPLGIMNEARAWAMFKRGVQAQRQIIESGKLPSREQAEADLFEGYGLAKAPVNGLYTTPERVHLSEPQHKAGDVIINHVPGYVFNSRKAWDAGAPAYSVSVGGFAEMNEPLNQHFGNMPLGALTVASAVRHAAIISVLPKPEGQEALNVHPVRHL